MIGLTTKKTPEISEDFNACIRPFMQLENFYGTFYGRQGWAKTIRLGIMCYQKCITTFPGLIELKLIDFVTSTGRLCLTTKTSSTFQYFFSFLFFF